MNDARFALAQARADEAAARARRETLEREMGEVGPDDHVAATGDVSRPRADAKVLRLPTRRPRRNAAVRPPSEEDRVRVSDVAIRQAQELVQKKGMRS